MMGKRSHPNDVVFYCDDMPGGFAEGIVRWLEIWADSSTSCRQLFARDVAPFVYTNDRFYTAAAAVEAYHRHHSESFEGSTAEHRAG